MHVFDAGQGGLEGQKNKKIRATSEGLPGGLRSPKPGRCTEACPKAFFQDLGVFPLRLILYEEAHPKRAKQTPPPRIFDLICIHLPCLQQLRKLGFWKTFLLRNASEPSKLGTMHPNPMTLCLFAESLWRQRVTKILLATVRSLSSCPASF